MKARVKVKVKARSKAKAAPPSKKILVVEDEPRILDYLETVLADWNYKVVSCQTGGEAVDKAVTERCDLILLDVMLPDMDGITLCRELRSHSESRHVPIIMLTVLSDSNTIRQAYSYGAMDFLSKPFTQADLKSKIQKVFHKTNP